MSNPQDSNASQSKHIQNTLVAVQRLTLKAVAAQNLQNLIFIILNDTFRVIKYDRSILFRIYPNKVEIIGVSGQYDIDANTELTSRLRGAVQKLKDPSLQRVLKTEDFSSPSEWEYIQHLRFSTVYWVPIKAGKEDLGLWLEIYDDKTADKLFESYASLLKEMIAPAYSIAWENLSKHMMRKLTPYFTFKNIGIASLLLFLLLFVIPVHLRIVAPCEVVAMDSFVVAAPLDGIIEKILVKPGQEIKKDQVLYEYDKKTPYYKYQATVKEVEILQSELNQAYALGTESEEEASKLAALQLKLNKSKVDLSYIKKQIELLSGKSPINGLVSINNPDDWRGRPVKVGEKIMEISNPDHTKLKIWVPERDNILFSFDIPIRVFLNSLPTKTFEAKLLFISPEVKIVEGELPSFEAEAVWTGTDNPKLGLKGSAVLYGERVSIFYYLFRKPIGGIRKFFGI